MNHPIERYRQLPVLLDTNLLILLLVGALGGDAIARCKRTARYVKEDYGLLRRVLAFFPSIIVTPLILAVSCNLLDSFNQERSQVPFQDLRKMMEEWEERFIPSAVLMSSPLFLKFGLTDASIADVATKGNPILSDDLKLVYALSNQGLPAFNFNYVRDHAYFTKY